MKKLVRWETPFTDCEFPSVLVYTSFGESRKFLLNAVVSPNGLDRYPKYLIDFGEALAFANFEEACAPKRDFSYVESDKNWSSASEYLNSPWLESYGPMFSRKENPLRHFLIFGGDSNLEVVTPKVPTFESIENSRVLSPRFVI